MLWSFHWLTRKKNFTPPINFSAKNISYEKSFLLKATPTKKYVQRIIKLWKKVTSILPEWLDTLFIGGVIQNNSSKPYKREMILPWLAFVETGLNMSEFHNKHKNNISLTLMQLCESVRRAICFAVWGSSFENYLKLIWHVKNQIWSYKKIRAWPDSNLGRCNRLSLPCWPPYRVIPA